MSGFQGRSFMDDAFTRRETLIIHASNRATSPQRLPFAHLDVATAVQVMQGVSGELDRRKLINALMVVAKAGAEDRASLKAAVRETGRRAAADSVALCGLKSDIVTCPRSAPPTSSGVKSRIPVPNHGKGAAQLRWGGEIHADRIGGACQAIHRAGGLVVHRSGTAMRWTPRFQLARMRH